jgi:hypothetical protein
MDTDAHQDGVFGLVPYAYFIKDYTGVSDLLLKHTILIHL